MDHKKIPVNAPWPFMNHLVKKIPSFEFVNHNVGSTSTICTSPEDINGQVNGNHFSIVA